MRKRTTEKGVMMAVGLVKKGYRVGGVDKDDAPGNS
jgi:hypothetical protein